MATSKKIQLVFDINSNDVTIATDKTLSLTQQVRIFKRELQGIPEGTREFEIVRNKINDTSDSLARVNTKSGEFFNTLSLLPGPIGDVSNQLDNSIGLLKTFSGFSLKDVGNQFKGLINDLAGIFDNFTGLNKKAKELADTNVDLRDSTANVSTSTKETSSAIKDLNATTGAQIQGNIQAAQSTKQLTSALTSQEDVSQAVIDAQRSYVQGLQDRKTEIQSNITADKSFNDLTKEQKAELASLNNQIIKGSENLRKLEGAKQLNNKTTQTNTTATKANTVAVAGQTAAENQNTGALVGNTAAGTANVVTTGAVTVAQRVATVATRVWTGALITLKAVLVSLGIGLLIQLLSTGASLLIDYFKGTEKAAEGTDKAAAANDRLAKAQEAVRKSTERGISTIEAETKAQVTRAKIADKTAEDIFRIEQNGLNRRIALLEQANKKLKGAEQNYTDEIIKLRREFAQNQLDFQLEQQKEREKSRKAELDAAIKLEIDKADTDKETLQRLLKERLDLELKELGNNENQKELARQEYGRKLDEAIAADEKKRNDRRLKELDAAAQLEIDKRDTDLKTLQSYYDEKLKIELQNEELSEAEKQALREKYTKLANEAINKDTLQRLQTELEANRGNYREQLRIYEELQTALTTSLNLNEQERASLIKQYQDALLQTLDLSYQNQVDALNVNYDEFRRFDKEYFDGQRAAQAQYQQELDDLNKKKTISDQEYLSRSLKLSKARRDIDLLERKTKQETVAAVGDAFGNLSKIVGEDTKAGKAFAIAKTTIDTYSSAVAAYRALAGIPVVGPALGAIAAAAAVAAGIANVKKIVSVQVPTDSGGSGGGEGATPPPPPIQVNAVKRAQGGMILGPGGQQSDSITTALSSGEFVVNARSTKLFGPLLDTINSYGALPQFAAAGLGAPGTNNMRESNDNIGQMIAESISQSPIRTYVTGQEISNQQQFDRVIKQRSLI
jgi:DNA repair exonuclease SbcCD ATPase subunit